eukprot:1148391-Ditylum_brightwellii.AAC.1
MECNFDYIPNAHITGVWHFLQLCGGAIQVYATWKPKTQQRNGAILMDKFRFTSPTNSMCKHLNKVRLYLGVTTLADIST